MKSPLIGHFVSGLGIALLAQGLGWVVALGAGAIAYGPFLALVAVLRSDPARVAVASSDRRDPSLS
jgi:hypothetical protein